MTLLALTSFTFAGVLYLRRQTHRRPATTSNTALVELPGDTPSPTLAGARMDIPPPAVIPTVAPGVDTGKLASLVAAADLAAARHLAERLQRNARLDSNDLRAAEDLYTRYPEPGRDLLVAVLVQSAQQARSARQDAVAATLLQRALVVSPGNAPALQLLVELRMDQGDWLAAETAARELLNVAPQDAGAVRALAFALVRLDRTREAVDVLTAFLQTHDDPEGRALLQRIRRDATTEASLGRQDIAHFHVRYDGDRHEDVGREVLRVLDGHYATLVRTFDLQPAEPIAVILLSRQSYYEATGAPAWSGGLYDTFDGRVRIPIGGLTTSLTPELDRVLLHELTHAFVTQKSGGVAPREIQEGLAQFVSGRRSGSPSDEPLRALATGRIAGVGAFYLASLAFVEELVAQRGQGGINDLLSAMDNARDVSAAFRQIYGKDFAALQAEFAARLRQRYGS